MLFLHLANHSLQGETKGKWRNGVTKVHKKSFDSWIFVGAYVLTFQYGVPNWTDERLVRVREVVLTSFVLGVLQPPLLWVGGASRKEEGGVTVE